MLVFYLGVRRGLSPVASSLLALTIVRILYLFSP